jgi:hypothetical protein
MSERHQKDAQTINIEAQNASIPVNKNPNSKNPRQNQLL